MLCPECNHNLFPVTIKNRTGAINLDYCDICGGVWSDQNEVNFLEFKDLTPLEAVLPKAPTHSGISYHLCPKDRATLELYRGESVPQDVNIFRCPTCRGIFFPDRSLVVFKQAQASKISYFKLWKIPLHSVYAILLPLLLVAVIGGGLIATLLGVRQGTDVRTRAKDIISKPLVLSPKENEIFISFTTQVPSVTKIKYWIQPDVITEVWVSTTPKTNHTVHLKQLELNESYSYQFEIVEPESLSSPIYLFSTEVKE